MIIPKKEFNINTIPAIVWGNTSKKLYLYIHGKDGNKEEANHISEVVLKYNYQVLSIDLPEHGDRKGETNSFNPWHIVPELNSVMLFAKKHWKNISLFANSIGAWFSMLCFSNERLNQCLFVSPVLDMKQLMLKMLNLTHVSEMQLKQERFIKTSSGQILSWDYWEYVQKHPIESWNIPTKILYGEKDVLINYSTVKQFADKFNCNLTVMANGEHWFHTDEQLTFMSNWLKLNVNKRKLYKRNK